MEQRDIELRQAINKLEFVKWNIPFKEVKDTVFIICDWLNPFFPNLERYEQMRFLLEQIDFDELFVQQEKESILKTFEKLKFFLSEVFESKITKEYKAFQNRVQYFALPDLIDYQTKIISLIGNLKEQQRHTKNESFNEYFIRLYDSLKASNKKRVLSIDYQIFIRAFNESLIDSLLLKFQILKETFDELIEAKKSSVPSNEDKLFYVNKFLGRTHGIITSIGNVLQFDDCNEKMVMQIRANRKDYSASYSKAIKELESLFLDSVININSVKKLIEMKVNENLETIKYFTPEIGSPMRFYINHLNQEITLFYKFKSMFEQIFGQSENTVIKQEGAKKQKDAKLSDLITHENSVEIVNAIKVQFKEIGGKRLKLLLMALQELNLLQKERVAKKFHECCQKEFNWDVKSYQAMNDYSFNDINDIKELEEMKSFIQEYIQ